MAIFLSKRTRGKPRLHSANSDGLERVYCVRQAGPADAAALVCFLESADAGRRDDGSQRLAMRRLDEAETRCWVVECGQQVIAIMSILVEAGRRGPRWLIESIYVDGAHRGRGVTRMLLGAVRDDAKRQQVRQLKTLCSPQGRSDRQWPCLGRLY